MKKLDKYINYIETVLANKNIDNEDSEWKQNTELKKLLTIPDEIYIIDSLTLGIDVDQLILLVKINTDEMNKELIEKIKQAIEIKIKNITNPQQQEIFKSINLLFFISSIHARLALKEAFSSKGSLDLIKKIKTAASVRSTKLHPVFYLDKDISMDEIKLPNIRRYEMVTLPPFDIDIDVPKENNHSTLKGYVFTANLFDLVNLYNTVGDQLFKKNVRLGIDDKLDVDKSIKETLISKPEAFWFRNNGITILVEEPHMKLDRVGEIILKESNTSDLKFSVINGAQTITAASEYYYSLSDKDRSNKSSIAKVIVKIIHIRDTETKNAEKEAKTISVSLNRQKPIKAEDIAFTNEFVDIMNDYLENTQAPYALVRRGEEFSSNIKAYSLINFAKARKACSGDPGAARSNATAALLKISPDTSQFHDQEIFISDWYSATEDEKKSYYDTYYSPVLFAMEMATHCQSIPKSSKLEGVAGKVIKNGMWYFIAYVIYLLNNGNDTDYSDFTYTFDNISLEELRVLFEEFSEFYCKNLNSTESNTTSNTFKTSDNYKILKNCDYEGTLFYQNICRIFGKKIIITHDNAEGKPPSHIKPFPLPSSEENSGIQVIFDNLTYNGPTKTEAFIYTIQKCLEKSSIDKYLLAVETLPFLTKNSNLDTGYFKSKKDLTIYDEIIYIGKSSSSNTKFKQLTHLCDILDIAPKTILWIENSSIIFEY